MSGLSIRLRESSAGLFLALLLAFSLVPSGVSAQTDDALESITLSPSGKRYQLDAGSVTQDKLTILNDGSTTYNFIVYARPYVIQNNDYTDPKFDRVENAEEGRAFRGDAYEWVQLTQSRWTIEPGQTLEIPFTLRVPANETPGGHYGVIFAETQPEAANSTSVVRKKRVGSIIYATVNGTYTTGGQSLGIEIPGLQFRSPLTSKMIVENSGNADFEATLTMRVSDLFGGVKYEEEKRYIVLPETTREMTMEWKDAPWFGLFKVQFSGTYLDKNESKDAYVLMIPRWMLVVLGVVVVGGGVYVTLRRRKR